MLVVFFFNDTATTEIYALSLHDALPISGAVGGISRSASPEHIKLKTRAPPWLPSTRLTRAGFVSLSKPSRSEEHTSELQSRQYLVCRLLLENNKRKCLEKMSEGVLVSHV